MFEAHTLQQVGIFIRDPAHAVRIACRDPLKAEDKYGKFVSDIFDAKHALVPCVQHSDAWRARLEACQQTVLRGKGMQGAGLTQALRHFSAAKQRFESFAGPARKYCLLLTAVATLLASVAGDARKPREERDRAVALLEGMTPESIVVAGLTADYTADCVDFVRYFDRHNVDPASVLQRRDRFLHRMRVMFLEGFIVMDIPQEPRAMTMVQAAMEQVLDRPVFHYGDRRHLLWCDGAAVKVEELMQRMHTVVQAMSDRVQAEINERDAATAFVIFDLAQWAGNVPQVLHQALHKRAGSLFRALQVDAAAGVSEFARALPWVLPLREEALQRERAGVTARPVRAAGLQRETCDDRLAHQTGTEAVPDCVGQVDSIGMLPLDNRRLWGALLADSRAATMTTLPKAIQLYLAVEYGSCGVERGLGRVGEILGKLSGPLEGQTTWVLVEALMDGPKEEKELFTRPDQSPKMRFTDLSRACQQLWLRLHGRRFSCQAKTVHRKPRGPRPGTENAVQEGRRQAVDALVLRAAEPTRAREACIGDVPRRRLLAGRQPANEQSPYWNASFTRFAKRTAAINPMKKREHKARRLGQPWCPEPTMVRACPAETGPPAPSPVATAVSVVVIRAPPGFEIQQAARVRVLEPLLANCASADVVVVPDIVALDMCVEYAYACVLVHAVGLGKTVMSATAWPRPPQERGNQALCFCRRVSVNAVCIVLGSHLQGHANLCAAFRLCGAVPGSKWKVMFAADAGVTANVLHLNSWTPFVLFC